MPVAGRRDNGAGRVAVRTSRSDLPQASGAPHEAGGRRAPGPSHPARAAAWHDAPRPGREGHPAATRRPDAALARAP